MSLRAFLFDAGDVLYHRPRRWRRIWPYLSELGLLPLTLDHPTWRNLKFKAQTGQITETEYWDRLLDLFGIRDPNARIRAKDILYDEERDIEFFDGVEQTLHHLKELGFQLAVVTDTIISAQEKLCWFRRAGIDDVWDSFATSCELKLVKPDERIYLAALAPLGVTPNEAAFVGHAVDELEGAQALGMTTIAFNRDNDDVSADYLIAHFKDLLDLARELM
jgi:HAD superfamily hydrolase (TIGR01509 family)